MPLRRMSNAFVDVRQQAARTRRRARWRLPRVGDRRAVHAHRGGQLDTLQSGVTGAAEERRRLGLTADADRRPEPADRAPSRAPATSPNDLLDPARHRHQRSGASTSQVTTTRGRRRHARACFMRRRPEAGARRPGHDRWSRCPTPCDPSKLQLGISDSGVVRAHFRRPDRWRLDRRAAALQNADLVRRAQPARPARRGDHRPAQRAAGARPRPRHADRLCASRCSVGAPRSRRRQTNAHGRRRAGRLYLDGSGVRVPSVSIGQRSTADALQRELTTSCGRPAGLTRPAAITLTRLLPTARQTRRERRRRRRLSDRRR